ncbi:MAG: hypothetical protein KF830_15570, partial [Planctomycetes bacterium]|nr:hypothetical protein [Planctomycetota bacterium]
LRLFDADGRGHAIDAATLARQIDAALAAVPLPPGAVVGNLCLPADPAALVPGLLAPLVAGACVVGDPAGAAVVVAPRAAAPARLAPGQRLVAIDVAPLPPPPAPPRRALAFTAAPTAPGEPMRFATTVPPDHFGFAGHFPTYPVLSGAVQLHELVLPCLRLAWGQVAPVAFTDLKFLARIAPGDAVEVVVRTVGGDRCEFEILRAGTRCSTGRVSLRAEPRP